jgi:hypothetical protein
MRFYGVMRTGREASLKTGAWFSEPNGDGTAPRRTRIARARIDEDHVSSTRVAIAASLFLVVLAPALLVGGRAAIEPLLQSAISAREARTTGDVVYAMPDGIHCRHMSFNNASAEVAEGSIQQCPDEIVRAHARAMGGFAWGR